MRRKDREITDTAEIEAIIRRCDCIHLGLMDGNRPYVVPLNFGMLRENGNFVFYMHGAMEGKKLELIRRNGAAAFCLDTGHRIVQGTSGCDWTCAYESVMGSGTVELVENQEEKRRGLECILGQYGGALMSLQMETLDRVAVFRLTVDQISGKMNHIR